MAHEPIKAKLLKLVELAERGSTDGERRNAQDAINRLLKKHGLTLQDIERQKIGVHWFSFVSKFDRSLIIQLVGCVTDTPKITTWKKNKKVGFELTAEQAADVRAMYDHYRKEWSRALRDLEEAFYNKHSLFPKSGGVSKNKMNFAEIERLLAAMRALQTTTFEKRETFAELSSGL